MLSVLEQRSLNFPVLPWIFLVWDTLLRQLFDIAEARTLRARRARDLVAQCSAIVVSVAATPLCSAIRFYKEHLVRHGDRGVAR